VLSERNIRKAYYEYQMNLLYENDHPEKKEVPYQYTSQEKARIVRGLFGIYEKQHLNFGTDLI